MINSLLFCKDDSSRLIFDGLCDDDVFLKRDAQDRDRSFFVGDLSFNIKRDSSFYLYSFSFKNRLPNRDSRHLSSNCIILNELLGADFKIQTGRLLVRKDWLKKFGSKTLFSKFNIKKDYIFTGDIIKVSKKYKCFIDRRCDMLKFLKDLSQVFKSKYKIKLLGKNTTQRSLMIELDSIVIPDPSLFVIESL